MARVFMEGFESGGYSSMTYDSSTATNSYSTNVKSWGVGTYSRRYESQSGGLGGAIDTYKTLASASEWYVRFSMLSNGISDSSYNSYLFHIEDSGSTPALRIGRTGSSGLQTLTAYKNTTSLGVIRTIDQGWHTYEIHITNTTGTYLVEIKLDGVLYLTYSDATPVGSANLARIHWTTGYGIGNALAGFSIDDIAVNDTTGATHNTWIGDGSVVALAPNGNGDLSELVGSDGNSTDNYLLVDERPHNSDTDYVKSTDINKTDLYQVSFPSLPSGSVFKFVWMQVVARKEGVSALGFKPVIKSLGTTTEDTLVSSITTSWTVFTGTIYENNPSTGSAWTNNDVDNLQVGVKVMAT